MAFWGVIFGLESLCFSIARDDTCSNSCYTGLFFTLLILSPPRFNRASLLNIGFMLSKNECDYMVMHDIDLLPLNDDLQYRYPAEGPLHISAPELHPLYHYKKFVGGILSMTREQFTRVSTVLCCKSGTFTARIIGESKGGSRGGSVGSNQIRPKMGMVFGKVGLASKFLCTLHARLYK